VEVGLYYFLESAEDDAIGMATAPENYSFDVLSEGVSYEDWEPVPFTLQDGIFADYQLNDLDWTLCSAKLKSVIDGNAAKDDVIQWLDAMVVDQNGKEARYYILHLPYRPEVLDREKTIRDDEFIDTPVLDLRLVKNHRVFSYSGAGSRVIVAEEVKTAIERAKCTGMEFWPVDDNHLT